MGSMENFAIAPQDENQDGNLTGKLLIASPSLHPHSYFSKKVIYLLQHSDSGSIGVIVNNPLEIKSVFITTEDNPPKSIDLGQAYSGGPISSQTGYILYLDESNGVDNTECIKLGINHSALQSVTQVGSVEEKQSLLVLGHCLWDSGQLENEIKEGAWIVLPSDRRIIFRSNNEDKWANCINSLKINTACYVDNVGNC